jgi:hypothetical protein
MQGLINCRPGDHVRSVHNCSTLRKSVSESSSIKKGRTLAISQTRPRGVAECGGSFADDESVFSPQAVLILRGIAEPVSSCRTSSFDERAARVQQMN